MQLALAALLTHILRRDACHLYAICVTLPVTAQEAMSTNADHVVRLPSAHMVQLSMPDRLAEALARI